MARTAVRAAGTAVSAAPQLRHGDPRAAGPGTRRIAPYKYPRAIEFMPSLPRTETGKLQRYMLRANAARSERANA